MPWLHCVKSSSFTAFCCLQSKIHIHSLLSLSHSSCLSSTSYVPGFVLSTNNRMLSNAFALSPVLEKHAGRQGSLPLCPISGTKRRQRYTSALWLTLVLPLSTWVALQGVPLSPPELYHNCKTLSSFSLDLHLTPPYLTQSNMVKRATQLCQCSAKTASVNEWVRLCSNKTLFIKNRWWATFGCWADLFFRTSSQVSIFLISWIYFS